MALAQTPIPDNWVEPVAQWEQSLKIANQSPNTIKTRLQWLRSFARHVPLGTHPWDVDAPTIEQYVSTQTWLTETRRGVYATLRGFYKWAQVTGRNTHPNPCTTLPKIPPPPPRPRPATLNQIRAGVANADPRTVLILHLAANAGLRRGEIAQLHADDIISDLCGYSLIVHGKGRKIRQVPCPALLARQLLAHAKGGYVFPGDINGHLSAERVGKLANRALPDGVTLHALRHAFATRAYASPSDLLAVQTLLGHTSPATTQRYVQLSDARLRQVAFSAAIGE